MLGQIKSDILRWKLPTLEAFFYTTSLHFLLWMKILINIRVIKLRSYVCRPFTQPYTLLLMGLLVLVLSDPISTHIVGLCGGPEQYVNGYIIFGLVSLLPLVIP